MHLPTQLTYNGTKPSIETLKAPVPTNQLPTLDREVPLNYTFRTKG